MFPACLGVNLSKPYSPFASCRSVRGVREVRVNSANNCRSECIKKPPPESGDFRGSSMSFSLAKSLVVLHILTSTRHATERHGRKSQRAKAPKGYSHSMRRVLYSVHLLYLVCGHPNMETHCDMIRHGVGMVLREIMKLKRNSVRLSFGICPSGKRGGAE